MLEILKSDFMGYLRNGTDVDMHISGLDYWSGFCIEKLYTKISTVALHYYYESTTNSPHLYALTP